MAIAVRRVRRVEVRVGPTLAAHVARKHPFRAAVRAAMQVGLVGLAVVLVLQWGDNLSVAHTLFFGVAAVVYLMADFVAELPDPSDGLNDRRMS